MGLQTFIKDAFQHFSAGLSERRLKRRLNDQIINDIEVFLKKNCSRMSLDAEYRKKLMQSIRFSLTYNFRAYRSDSRTD